MSNHPNVIGPIDRRSWQTMRMLREAIKDYKEDNPKRYKAIIEADTMLYNEYIDIIVNRIPRG